MTIPTMPQGAEPNPSLEDEGQNDIQGSPSDEPDTGEGLHQTLPPRDYPQALDEYGVTAEEQLLGEPMDVRLAREEPDPQFQMGPGRDSLDAGRLVEPDSGDIEALDKTAEAVARDVGYDSGGLSAEEAAVHIEE